MKISTLFAAVACATLMGPSFSEVLKCKGPDGKIIYSDSVCGIYGSPVGGLNANTLRAQEIPREKIDPSHQQLRQASKTVASVCPTDREIENMETSASSITYRNKRAELDFLHAEIRRARACSKEESNYSEDDWKRIRQGQGAQSNSTSESRKSGRDLTKTIHSSAASDREQDRMRSDDLIEAERVSKRRARPAPPNMASCDRSGCWDTSGVRYKSAAGGNMIRSDGKFCTRVGEVLNCN